MTELHADAVIRAITYAEDLYHRLVLVVGPSGAGKTGVLHDVHARIGATLLNVNLELTRSMLGLTMRQRALYLRAAEYDPDVQSKRVDAEIAEALDSQRFPELMDSEMARVEAPMQ